MALQKYKATEGHGVNGGPQDYTYYLWPYFFSVNLCGQKLMP